MTYLVQFSSGGAILPEFVATHASRNIILAEYFEKVESFIDYETNPFLDKYFDLNNIASINDYVYYAQKGILSFDKTNPSPGNFDITYHLLATPKIFLDLTDLPKYIRNILLETKQSISFSNFYKIDAGYIPWSSLFIEYCVPFSYEPKPKRKSRFW